MARSRTSALSDTLGSLGSRAEFLSSIPMAGSIHQMSFPSTICIFGRPVKISTLQQYCFREERRSTSKSQERVEMRCSSCSRLAAVSMSPCLPSVFCSAFCQSYYPRLDNLARHDVECPLSPPSPISGAVGACSSLLSLPRDHSTGPYQVLPQPPCLVFIFRICPFSCCWCWRGFRCPPVGV